MIVSAGSALRSSLLSSNQTSPSARASAASAALSVGHPSGRSAVGLSGRTLLVQDRGDRRESFGGIPVDGDPRRGVQGQLSLRDVDADDVRRGYLPLPQVGVTQLAPDDQQCVAVVQPVLRRPQADLRPQGERVLLRQHPLAVAR